MKNEKATLKILCPKIPKKLDIVELPTNKMNDEVEVSLGLVGVVDAIRWRRL